MLYFKLRKCCEFTVKMQKLQKISRDLHQERMNLSPRSPLCLKPDIAESSGVMSLNVGELLERISVGFRLFFLFIRQLIVFLREVISMENLRDPDNLVIVFRRWIRKIDMGGTEIYFLFVGGCAFILLSNIFSIFISPIINQYLFPIWRLDAFIRYLAAITLTLVFGWFIWALTGIQVRAVVVYDD